MELLLHPKKTPLYRARRSHTEFLTHLSLHSDSQENWIKCFKETLRRLYDVSELPIEEIPVLSAHRKTTTLLSF